MRLLDYLPEDLQQIELDQEVIPTIAKSERLMKIIEDSIQRIPTEHRIIHGDSRDPSHLRPNSIHLVLTSPPYWTLKRYIENEDQLGHIADYEDFLVELDKVWSNCYNALVKGGRLICVVGDVCLSRRKNQGEHTVVPLHSSIQEHCRKMGYANLGPIIWHKIANASYEVNSNSRFLGKPYEPNGIVKNDIEYLLMERKSGGYRKPSREARILSVISDGNHKEWFQQIWFGITGASTSNHPAPFPARLAERLIRMYSFVGDTVYDPFMGTGTTNLAAARWGRNSIGVEIEPKYIDMAIKRINEIRNNLYREIQVNIEGKEKGKYERLSNSFVERSEGVLGNP